MFEIPDHVLSKTFSWLNLKDIISIEYTCKYFNKIIKKFGYNTNEVLYSNGTTLSAYKFDMYSKYFIESKEVSFKFKSIKALKITFGKKEYYNMEISSLITKLIGLNSLSISVYDPNCEVSLNHVLRNVNPCLSLYSLRIGNIFSKKYIYAPIHSIIRQCSHELLLTGIIIDSNIIEALARTDIKILRLYKFKIKHEEGIYDVISKKYLTELNNLIECDFSVTNNPVKQHFFKQILTNNNLERITIKQSGQELLLNTDFIPKLLSHSIKKINLDVYNQNVLNTLKVIINALPINHKLKELYLASTITTFVYISRGDTCFRDIFDIFWTVITKYSHNIDTLYIAPFSVTTAQMFLGYLQDKKKENKKKKNKIYVSNLKISIKEFLFEARKESVIESTVATLCDLIYDINQMFKLTVTMEIKGKTKTRSFLWLDTKKIKSLFNKKNLNASISYKLSRSKLVFKYICNISYQCK